MSVTLTQTGTIASGSNLSATGIEIRSSIDCSLLYVDTASNSTMTLSGSGTARDLQFVLEFVINGGNASFSGTATLTNADNTLNGTFVRSTGGPSGSFILNRQVASATPLPPPPTTQTVFTASTGQMPAAAVSVNPSGTFGNATLVVTLDLSKVLSGGSFAAQGQFAAGYNIYVAALVPSGVLGLPSATWFVYPATHAWAELGSPIAAYLEGLAPDATNTVEISILQGMDVTGLLGSEIYIGYGTSDTEMLAASRYRGVYKVQ